MLTPESLLFWQEDCQPIYLNHEDLVVITPEQEVLLSYDRFPLFRHIDGRKTIGEITSFAQTNLQANEFLSQVRYFLSQKQLISLNQGLEPSNNIALLQPLRVLTDNLYSTFSGESLDKIITQLKETRLTHKTTIAITSKLINPSKIKELVIQHPVIFLIIGKDSLKLSPLLKNIEEVEQFCSLIMANMPVLNYFSGYVDDKQLINQIDLKRYSNLSAQQLNSLVELIKKQINSNEPVLYNIDLKLNKLEHHNVIFGSAQNSPRHVNRIKLHPKPVRFDKDGGSRTIAAEQTIERLLPHVSPICGAITHIEEIKKHSSTIKIYKSAFFRTPPKKANYVISEASFVQVCLGKGVTHEQSKASALCEAVERKNAQYVGDELTQVAQTHQLSARSYSFSQLLPCSEQQYARFADPADSESQRKQAALSYTGEAVNWTALWSLTRDEKVYVPTTCCFANTPFEEDRFGKWHSNGCAAGNNLEEAILQALFELLERDATAIWWYNRLPRPQFELSGLDPDYLAPLHETITAEHDYWVLDLTVDTGVP